MAGSAKQFLDKDFLLETGTARTLFHSAAKDAPIYDYHCHLIPQQIAENKKFANLAEIWLGGDHYKWRMMRAMGFDEYYITGSAAPYEKFLAWAKTVENLIGNPLYHWTHLELQRCFDIYEPLTEKTAPSIWERGNAKLQSDELSVKGIFAKFKVHTVGTTDDPADCLEYHQAIASGKAPIDTIATRVIPSFRPDKALNSNLPGFAEYIGKLAKASGVSIKSVDDVIAALENRLDFFAENGCRASDHALEYPPFVIASDKEIEQTFKDALAGKPALKAAADAYKTKVLTALSRAYAKRGIAMQLHLAALRNVNGRMFAQLGADTGYDAVHDCPLSENLAGLLSHLEAAGGLPKTVLYSLNSKDYYPLATIMGGFQDNYSQSENRAGIRGKMQLGSGWWFCDHKDGMEEQMRVLASVGLLPAFVGMLTDSRSFLSYPRHEYFRRILCNLLGAWVENGEYPADAEKLAEIARNISFGNAKAYFG
ncbi:MAG: glucuronate isomerase [Treponema sp.]|jgi:glucuronate isomerase|nr:glucuronate isomerase [Treponema sp.]